MKQVLQSVNKIDWLIFIMAVWILIEMDMNALTTVDIIYLITFAIWLVLFVVRLFLIYRNMHHDG